MNVFVGCVICEQTVRRSTAVVSCVLKALQHSSPLQICFPAFAACFPLCLLSVSDVPVYCFLCDVSLNFSCLVFCSSMVGSPTSPDHKSKRQSDPTPFGYKGNLSSSSSDWLFVQNTRLQQECDFVTAAGRMMN